MVTRYGMSEEFDMMALETVTNQYLGGDASLMCSPEASAKIDREVLSIIKSAHNKARQILEENIDKLHEHSNYLLEKETITGEEFMAILNGKPVEEVEKDSEEKEIAEEILTELEENNKEEVKIEEGISLNKVESNENEKDNQ